MGETLVCVAAYWVNNARTVLTNIGLAVALWYFLDAVDAWTQVTAAWGSLTDSLFQS